MIASSHEGFYADGVPRAARSSGEEYESCIRCHECRRIWWWGNVLVDDEGMRCICVECLSSELGIGSS